MTIEQYDKLRSVVTTILLSAGYTIKSEHESPQAFGSAHVTFQKQNAAIQFIWDGKEDWFRLLYCPNIDSVRPAWDDIATENFDACQHNEERIDYISRILESRLQDFIQHPHKSSKAN